MVHESLSDVLGDLTALEGAKLQVAIAFTLASLFYVNANLKGKDLSAHPIHEELSRIKSFVAQLNQREKLMKAGEAKSEQDSEQPSKRLRIDSGAAKRIVKHHL